MPASHRPVQASPVRVRPGIELLEDRCNPSITVRFDYSMDTSGFFNDASHRAALERAAADVTARVQDQLSAVVPSGGNSWTATTINGLTGGLVQVNNLSVNANELVIFIVGGPLGGSELGIASGGAYSAQGGSDWLRTIRTRGQGGVDTGTDFASWGGMIAFSNTANWSFAESGPGSNQFDFQSVATHELMHVLGFGLGNASFDRYTGSGRFTGPNASAVYGSAVPMQPGSGSDHFAAGTKYNGAESPMAPALGAGTKRRMTELDYAALRDIGWSETAAPAVPPTAPPASAPPVVPPTGTIPSSSTTSPVGTSAGTSNDARTTFAVGSGAGAPAAFGYGSGEAATFSTSDLGGDFDGGARVAVGDFDGDGAADYAVAAGPGRQPEVKVFSGRTGQVMSGFLAYEWFFTGGVYVAAGDINGDGRDELVLGAGAGGGPRARVLDLLTGEVLADFWGIADGNFRGGARVAVGDIDGDGRADLVVSAGETGGPRVAVYSGRSIGNRNIPVSLAPDFFAFEPNLTNGSYVAVGDVNGDGKADVIVGSGEGGGPRVVVYDGAALTSGRLMQTASFFAGDAGSAGGVRVAAADVNHDGLADIVTGSGPNSDGAVRVYSGLSALRSATPTVLQQYTSSDWTVGGAFVG